MSVVIFLIADCVLPESALPNSAFAGTTFYSGVVRLIDAHRKLALQDFPSRREIVVAVRQAPQAMNVVGKNDHRDCFKRKTCSRLAERRPKSVDPTHEEFICSVYEVDSEEICPARNVKATIIRHSQNVWRMQSAVHRDNNGWRISSAHDRYLSLRRLCRADEIRHLYLFGDEDLRRSAHEMTRRRTQKKAPRMSRRNDWRDQSSPRCASARPQRCRKALKSCSPSGSFNLQRPAAAILTRINKNARNLRHSRAVSGATPPLRPIVQISPDRARALPLFRGQAPPWRARLRREPRSRLR